MKTKTACLALLFILILNSFFAKAQQYAIKESEIIYEDFLHDLFAVNTVAKKYIVVNYTGRHGAFSYKRDELNTSVDIYNAQLKQIATNAVKELKGKKYIGGFSSGNKIFLFYVENETKIFKFELNTENGSALSSPEKLFSFTGQNFQFFKGASADSSYYYLISANHDDKSKDEKYDGVIIDNQMNVVNQFSFKIDGLREYTASTVFALSNKGILDVISAIRIKTEKSNYTPVVYEVRQINKDGLEFNKTLKDIPEGLFYNAVWQNKDDRLEFTGLLSKSKKEGYTSILSGTLDEQEQKIVNIKNSEITPSTLQNIPQRFAKEITKEGIPTDANWAGSYSFKDGSLIILLQSSSIYYDRYGSPSFESENIYILKSDPNKKLEWIRVIPKNQWEIGGEIYNGFIAVKNKDDGIHIYFHDYYKNDNIGSDSKPDRSNLGGSFKNINLADVYVTKEGKMSKQFFFEDKGSDFQLSTHDFLLLPDEILFTSYYRRNLGKSQYRLGVMSLK